MMLALLLFRELISIEFPATTNSSKKAFLFFRECEEILLKSISSFAGRLSICPNSDDK